MPRRSSSSRKPTSRAPGNSGNSRTSSPGCTRTSSPRPAASSRWKTNCGAREARLRESEALCQESAEPKRQAQTQVLEIQAQFWPAGLRAESWGPWRERLLAGAAAEPAAAILLARLHTAAALESSGRPLPLELVRDLGHSVYEACPEDAEKLAQALTQAAGGRFDIKAVRVGDRIDKRFMQPSAAGLVEVRAVSGWAVRDAAGKWQFLADVS